ncbi:MAG: PD-(D/E)XK nuclease family protein, partial [Gammaproteobacteria bacterium]|nr:PD-(D/E)XK nuclease family protein [Gammaproteobacteria bacterium]
DSGRYPSVTHFLNKLRSLKKLSTEAPDEAPANSGLPRVTVMTIHAAKGLEAPVVFMADTASQSSPKLAHNAMVNWPTNEPKPDAFHLMGVKTGWDNVSKKYVDIATDFQSRETLNLLYVALTRAKQYIFISGSEPNKSNKTAGPSWYQLIEQGMKQLTKTEEYEDTLCYESGNIEYSTETLEEPATNTQPLDIPEALSQVIFDKEEIEEQGATVTPSQSDQAGPQALSIDDDSMTRGTVIHRALELLTDNNEISDDAILLQLKIESGDLLSNDEYQECLSEARQVISEPAFTHLFDEEQYQKHFNELPIHYQASKKDIHGVIDRVVINDGTVYLIDYKTHQNLNKENISVTADEYKTQMQLYKQGLQQIWP